MIVENEVIIRKTSNLKDVSNEKYSDLYKTKDIYLAAFLISRGFEWFGLEEVEVVKTYNKSGNLTKVKRPLIYFLFENKSQIEKMALHYFNHNRANLNVNANNFVQSILSMRSIITDPPF